MMKVYINEQETLLQRLELITDRSTPFTRCVLRVPIAERNVVQKDASVRITYENTTLASGRLTEITETKIYVQGYVHDQAEKLHTAVSISYANRGAVELAQEVCTQCGIAKTMIDLPAQTLRHFQVHNQPGYRVLHMLLGALHRYGHDTTDHRVFCDEMDVLRIQKTPLQKKAAELSVETNVIRRFSDRLVVMPRKVLLRHSHPVRFNSKEFFAQRTRLVWSIDTRLLEVYLGAPLCLPKQHQLNLQLALVRENDPEKGTLNVEIIEPGSLEGTGFYCETQATSQAWANNPVSVYAMPAVGSYVLLGYIDGNPGFPVILQCFGSKNSWQVTNGNAHAIFDGQQGTVALKNTAASLKSILEAILDIFLKIGTVGSPVKQQIDPSTIIGDITFTKTKINGLFHE